jgi:hypothetical protein
MKTNETRFVIVTLDPTRRRTTQKEHTKARKYAITPREKREVLYIVHVSNSLRLSYAQCLLLYFRMYQSEYSFASLIHSEIVI